MQKNLTILFSILVIFASLFSLEAKKEKTNILKQNTQNTYSAPQSSADPSFDHQNTTYVGNHSPASTTSSVSITPFFSPDHSLPTIVDLIASAKESIDIGTPGFSSWINCTQFDTQCVGCTVQIQSTETFPVWQALLNAIHSGKKVRILTNDFLTPDCDGMISPLTYLQLAGADIRYYTTTTFLHEKYTAIDGTTAAVSSVNSDYTSYLKNREAGVVVSNAPALTSFMTDIFDLDFNQGIPYQVNQTYSSAEMAIINNKKQIAVNLPSPLSFSCKTASPTPAATAASFPVTVISNPDFAFSSYMEQLKSVKKSLYVSIYQINDPSICSQLIEMNKNGIELHIFVSDLIFDASDWKTSQVCYSQLYYAGITVMKSCRDCLTYSHQKFWILDGETVVVSTGNWSPSDEPNGTDIYPPYPNSNWRIINRDYTVAATDPTLVSTFMSVFYEDYDQGFKYYPDNVANEKEYKEAMKKMKSNRY